MKKLFYFFLVLSVVGCIKQVKPKTDVTEPVFIEEDTTTYKPIDIVKDTVPKITEINPVIEPPKIETQKYIYRIQVGAFKTAEYAERLKTEISSLFKVNVLVKYEGGYYKVRVGEFKTRTEAEGFLNKLINSGYNGFIKEEEIK